MDVNPHAATDARSASARSDGAAGSSLTARPPPACYMAPRTRTTETEAM